MGRYREPAKEQFPAGEGRRAETMKAMAAQVLRNAFYRFTAPVPQQQGPPQLRAEARSAFPALDIIYDCGPSRAQGRQVLSVRFASHCSEFATRTFAAIVPWDSKRGRGSQILMLLVDKSKSNGRSRSGEIRSSTSDLLQRNST